MRKEMICIKQYQHYPIGEVLTITKEQDDIYESFGEIHSKEEVHAHFVQIGFNAPQLTVGDLKKILEGLDDSTPITVYDGEMSKAYPCNTIVNTEEGLLIW